MKKYLVQLTEEQRQALRDLVVVFVVLTIVATPLNGPAGPTQRIFIIVGWSWIAVLAIRLMSRSVPLA